MTIWENSFGPFTIIDVLAAIFFLYIVVSSARAGLIRSLGNLLGSILGIALAGRLYDDFARFIPGTPTIAMANLLSFGLIYLAVAGIVAIVVWIIDRLFSLMRFIPGIGTINVFGGAVIGIVKAGAILGILLFVAGKFPISEGFTKSLENSILADYLVLTAKFVVLLLPEALRQLPGVFQI